MTGLYLFMGKVSKVSSFIKVEGGRKKRNIMVQDYIEGGARFMYSGNEFIVDMAFHGVINLTEMKSCDYLCFEELFITANLVLTRLIEVNEKERSYRPKESYKVLGVKFYTVPHIDHSYDDEGPAFNIYMDFVLKPVEDKILVSMQFIILDSVVFPKRDEYGYVVDETWWHPYVTDPSYVEELYAEEEELYAEEEELYAEEEEWFIEVQEEEDPEPFLDPEEEGTEMYWNPELEAWELRPTEEPEGDDLEPFLEPQGEPDPTDEIYWNPEFEAWELCPCEEWWTRAIESY